MKTIPADDQGVYAADISSDGRTLVTGGDGPASSRLWDLADGIAAGRAA